MFCENCGTKIEGKAEFCHNCGRPTSGTTQPVSATDKTSNHTEIKLEKIIKCGNCDYVGPGEPARSMWAKILAWLCVFFAPIVTIIYFVATHKYRCPKCKSTFLGIKNKDGAFVGQKGGAKSPVMILIWVLVGIAIIGILSSVVLASLNTAREKAKKAQGITSSTELTYEVMQEVARDSNNELPMMLDSETRWDYTEGIENGLIYKYTLVNYSVNDLKGVNLSEVLRKDLVDEVCSSSDMEVYIKNGATLKYVYYDMNGLFIGDVVVNTGTDCKYQF